MFRRVRAKRVAMPLRAHTIDVTDSGQMSALRLAFAQEKSQVQAPRSSSQHSTQHTTHQATIMTQVSRVQHAPHQAIIMQVATPPKEVVNHLLLLDFLDDLPMCYPHALGGIGIEHNNCNDY